MPSTSPSVYVAFQSLNATDLCGLVGTTIARTTLAFAPDALSTYNNIQEVPLDAENRYNRAFLGDVMMYKWSAFDYADLQ